MTYRVTDVSLPGGWKQRQDRAAEKRRIWQERAADPDIQARDRAIAAQREAEREARERAEAERNAKTGCPCCRAGSFNKADARKMVRLLIRSMGVDAVTAIFNDAPELLQPTAPVEASADPGVAELIKAEVARALAESVAHLTVMDESESCDPSRDPLRGQEPARRGRGRPPRVAPAA